MMKNLKLVAIAAAIVAMASSSAMAFYTGQINIPSTDAKGFKEVTVGINNYARFSSAADAGPNYYDLGLTAGVLPFEKIKLEIGTDYSTAGVGSAYPFTFNAKLATPEDVLVTGMPAFAVGGLGLGTIDAQKPVNIMYALVAKTLPVIGRLSAGGYTGDKNNLLDANGKKDNSGVLASWDRSITEVSDKLWLAVDYMSGNNSLGGLGLGGSWTFSKQVSLLTGVTFYNEQKTGGKPTFTTQLLINLP
ncbi:MAG: hypothetical protein PHI31_01245 [Desulfuromonadaceae bacterium]|nr:hypothetical protein [Desulfuromonadaceae bacterium]